MSFERVLVVLPTYNESQTISSHVQEVLTADPRIEVLVVDDSSPDGTGNVVASLPEYGTRVHLFRRPGKLGYSSACRDGLDWALKDGYQVAILMDADGSHPVSSLPLFIKELETGEVDFVMGSRYIPQGGVKNWGVARHTLSRCAGIYVRLLTGLPIQDPTSGFKAMHAEAVRVLLEWGFQSVGYAFNVETQYVAWKKGFRIKELPIIFHERRGGVSKMSFRIMIEAALSILKLALARCKRVEYFQTNQRKQD